MRKDALCLLFILVQILIYLFQTNSPDFRETFKLQNKRILLTVGRLQTRKGQDHMIAAMPELLSFYPNLHYVIVGSGDDEQKLRDSITELNRFSIHVL